MSRLASMVEKWNKCGDMPRIERDMALEELRRIYDELLDYTPQHAENPVVEEVIVPAVEEPKAEADETIEDRVETEVEEAVAVVAPVAVAPAVVAAHEDVGDAFDDALDIDALLGLSGDDSIEEAEAALSAEEPAKETEEESIELAEPIEPEPEVEETPEPEVDEVVEERVEEVIEEKTEAVEEKVDVKAEESAPERPIGGGLFDIDDIPVHTKRGRKMISLYDAPIKTTAPVKEAMPEPAEEIVVMDRVEAEPITQPTPAPAPAPAPAPMPAPREEEAPQRLGDIYAKNTVTTLADKMAEEQPTAAYNRITDIRKAIGLNDKFLMIRDLFGGDVNLYEDTINHLNEYDDLDECMIFIVENFRWNPDSEGAKLLVSLLERKLS